MSDVDVVALCDLYLDKAESCADQNEAHYGAGHRPFVTDDYKKILDMKDVDAIVICTAWDDEGYG